MINVRDAERLGPVAEYCRQFLLSGKDAQAFASYMLVYKRELCARVMDIIGSWPSSEAELRALQRAYL